MIQLSIEADALKSDTSDLQRPSGVKLHNFEVDSRGSILARSQSFLDKQV